MVVAEDNVDHQRVIAEVIRRLGHEAVVTGDGRAALDAVQERRPALVVADIDMPHLDGLQLSRALHDDPALAGIPIVLITGYFLPGDPRLEQTGARAVISKPFTVPGLADELRRHLPRPLTDPCLTDALLDSLDTGVMACDTAGRLTLFSRTMREIFGDAGSDTPVAAWAADFHLRHHDGTALSPAELPLSRALAGERVQRADLLADDRKGRPHWFTVNARPIRDTAGAIAGAVAAVHDITVHYRMRQYQNCKAEVLRVLAQEGDAGVVGERVLAAIGTTLDWPYLRLWLLDDVTGLMRPAASWTAPGESAPAMPSGSVRGQGLAGVCWERGELIWVPDIHAEGSPVLPQVAATATFGAAGAVPVRSGEQVTGVLTFFERRDQGPDAGLGMLLTGIAGVIGAFFEHRRAEMLATHLAAATDEYIALVGHELRTPLTSIGAYVDLIADLPGDTPLHELREMFDVVRRNNVRLRELVDRLLDLAALESGHADLKLAPVDLVTLIREVAPEATAELPAELVVQGDAARLRQMIDALVGNAVKFGPPDVAVTIRLADENGDTAVLAITDNGSGISPAEHAKLFRRLYRGANARHTGIPGAGLGLALSRAVVERHHGTITLASREGAGTTVTVRLPRSG